MMHRTNLNRSTAHLLFVWALSSACGDDDAPQSNGDAGTQGELGDGGSDSDSGSDSHRTKGPAFLEGYVFQCLGANCPGGSCMDSDFGGEVELCKQVYKEEFGETTTLCKAGLVGNYFIKMTPGEDRDWTMYHGYLVECDGGKASIWDCETGYEGTGDVFMCI